MAGTSNTTTLVTLRLPNAIIELAKQRVTKSNRYSLYKTYRQYLQSIIIYELSRKHSYKTKKENKLNG